MKRAAFCHSTKLDRCPARLRSISSDKVIRADWKEMRGCELDEDDVHIWTEGQETRSSR
jgi:hypothetical protein